MTVVTRRPVLEVYIDGRLLPKVLGARVSRGLDQDYATAEVSIPWPAPIWVRQWSRIAIRMGGSIVTARERLSGYVTGFTDGLWPGTITLQCGDTLALAKYYYPSDEIDFSGLTDEEIITSVLTTIGLPASMMDISGTGKIVGDDPSAALTWPRLETALGVIQEIDQMSLGFRTQVDPGGLVRRFEVQQFPGSSFAHELVEGEDLLDGSVTWELVDPKNEVTVIGDGFESTVDDAGANTYADWRQAPISVRFAALQTQATSGTHLSTEEVALWVLDQVNRNLVRATCSLYRDDLCGVAQTVHLVSVRLRCDQNFWLQSVTTEIDAQGQFSQELQLVSEISLGELGPEVLDPLDGIGSLVPLPPPVPPVLPPPTVVEASFAIIAIEREVVLIAAVETTIYTVSVADTSQSLQSTIVSRAWSAAGPGVTITSGTDQTFTTSFTSLTGAEITLQVTDALANVGSLTRDLSNGAGQQVTVRKLYAATSADWEVFDGAVWRTHTPASAMLALAPGPQAGAGTAALRTADNLVTPALSTTPFTTSNVTAIWVESDVSETNVVAGAADGRVAVSNDGGATWTVKDGPGGEVRRIIASRFTPGQIHLICDAPANGYYTSDNSGDDWTLQRVGDFTDLILSHSRNAVVTVAGGLQRAEAPGEPFTFPGSPTIISAAPHIRQDAFYAWAADGSTYATTTPGGFAMSARQAVPAGTPQVRGADHDAVLPDLVYMALGAGGAYKSLDGLRTATGYLKLRDGNQILITHGDLTTPPASAVGVFIATTIGAFAYDSGADTWSDITPDAGDDTLVAIAAEGANVWVASDTPTLWHSSDSGTSWTPVALPGASGSCDTLVISGTTLIAARNDCTSSADNGFWTRPSDGSGSWTQVYASGTNFAWNGDIVGSRMWFARNNGTTREFHYLTPVSLGGTDTTVSGTTGPSGTAVGITADPTAGSKAYACVGFDFTPGPPKLYRCNDGTATDITPSGMTSDGTNGFVDVASDGSDVVALLRETGGSADIYHSDDEGATWAVTHSTTGLPSNDWPAVRWSTTTTGRVVVAWGNGIAISNNSGVSWTDSAAAPGPAMAMAVL